MLLLQEVSWRYTILLRALAGSALAVPFRLISVVHGIERCTTIGDQISVRVSGPILFFNAKFIKSYRFFVLDVIL